MSASVQERGAFTLSRATQKSLVILFRSFGPYHVARVCAAAKLFEKCGIQIVGMELCDREGTHPWEVDRSELPFDLWTVAPGQAVDEVNRGNVSRRVTSILSEKSPHYLAVAGYDRPEMRAAARWAKDRGVPCVLMADTKWDDRPRRWWASALKRRFLKLFGAALVGGATGREYLVTFGFPRERIFIGYATVKNAMFAEKAEQHRATNNTRRGQRPFFLDCCRLIEERKNLRRLILAYKAHRDLAGETAWDLVICGDGADRNLVESTVSQEGVSGVQLPGYEQVDELAVRYATASCFIHPAIKEPWGLVVNEAMASGLPVLVSRRCGCAHDLVHEGVNGWTFNPYDIREMTEFMLRVTQLKEEARLHMGEESQRIIRRWSPESFAQGLLRAIGTAERALSCGSPAAC